MKLLSDLETTTFLYLSAVTLLVAYALFQLLYKGRGMWGGRRRGSAPLPPGPRVYPLFGNIMSLAGDPLEYCRQCAKKYGGIWMMQMGVLPVVVLSDIEILKEAFTKQADVFSDRLRVQHIYEAAHGAAGIASANGRLLMEVRKFTLTALRGLGVGKKSLEDRIHEETTALVHALKQLPREKATDPHRLVACAVSNVICNIVFGERYEYHDKEFEQLLKMMDENFSRPPAKSVWVFLPWLRFLPQYRKAADSIKHNLSEILTFIRARVEQHRSSFDPNNIRDVIDMFLREQENRRAELGMEEAEKVTNLTSDHQMAKTLADLFFAGTETTGTTLRWGILFLCLNPEVQSRVQNELDEVIGSPGSQISALDDRDRLPYTAATISEVQRLGDIAPLSIFHLTKRETELSGFYIPKNALVIAHLNFLHTDDRIWEEPLKFDPGRFLDGDGNYLKTKPQGFLPFSIGRRVCLGESLAKMELFLFFTAIVHNFHMELSADSSRQSLPGHLGLTRSPLPYKVHLTLR